LSEAETPLAPATLYGRAKLALGSTMEGLGQAGGASFAHGRVFFLYGPHEAPERLVPSVTAALLRGERAPTTDGVQQRDFLHVDDVAAALVALLHADAVAGPENIASGSPVPVRDVVAAIAEEVGRPDLVGWGEVQRGASDPDLVAGDAARLRDEVGFSPRYGLREGIRATVDWWRGRAGVR
jgi:nucleoside-diphosphate-sugar epimerase